MSTSTATRRWTAQWMALAGASLALAGCGGGGGGGGGGGSAALYSLGGTVTGLDGTVVLHTNTGDQASIDSNRAFTFATKLKKGQTYVVTVLSQPAGQTCNVMNGSGFMPAADVSDVSVVCSGPPVAGTIGGTINGLSGTVVLSPGYYMDDQSFADNGPFAFTEQSAVGNSYNVVVTTQPDGQVCSVGNGYGLVTPIVDTVQVNCVDATATFAVGGTITGLHGSGLVITNGPADEVTPASDAIAFTMTARLGNTAVYDLAIAAQPAGQTCVITNATGTVNAADVMDVDVQCIDNITDPLVGTYTVPGLQPGSYVYVTLFPDGVYIFGSIEDNPNCDVDTLGNGVEYGAYRYDAATHEFSIQSAVVDSNGECGLWDSGGSRFDGTLTVAGSGASTVLTLTPSAGGGAFDLVPVPSVAGEITGSWAAPGEKNVLIVLPGGGVEYHYLYTETQRDVAPFETYIEAGVEYACATITSPTHGYFDTYIDPCGAPTPSGTGSRDTNGRAGFSWWGGQDFSVAGDTLSMAGGPFTRLTPP